MRSLISLTGVIAVALASHAGAATLNKCIDAKGEITYSNLPCRNAREVRTVEVDPAPPSDPVPTQAVRAQDKPASAKPAKPKSPPAAKEPAPIHLEAQRSAAPPVSHASARQCDALTDKLGRIFDKMDQARRKGYTQDQMDKWNLEVKDLERKKQQSGCF